MAALRSVPANPQRPTPKLTLISALEPNDIGIHRAAPLHGFIEESLTPYVPRDSDVLLCSELDRASAHGGMVVVVGDSAAGKSRSVYVALRERLSGWRLFIPRDASDVMAAPLPARTVVWLDDTPSLRFLTPSGLTAADLAPLISDRNRPIVVICILWPSAYDEITRQPPEDIKFNDPMVGARDALKLTAGLPVMISSTFSEPERVRAAEVAAASSDQRLVSALADDRFGVTQNIAGAPQLAEHWRRADVIHPAGAALLTAAIDIRRLGIRQPLTSKMLQTIIPFYLNSAHHDGSARQSFRDALRYARRPLVGGVRALTRLPGPRSGKSTAYEVHDYLLQTGVTDRRSAPVPSEALDILVSRITDLDELARFVLAADSAGLVRHAEALIPRLRLHDPRANWRLVELLVSDSDEAQLRKYIGAGICEARLSLAELLVDQDRIDEAVSDWGHPDVDDTQWWGLAQNFYFAGHDNLIRRLNAAGDVNGRLLYLELLERDGCEDELATLASADDLDVAGWAQTHLARLYVTQGRFEEAIEEYFDLMQREDGDFADEATRAWASLMVQQDNEDALRDWAADNPDYGLPKMFLADLLAKHERLDELRELANGHEISVEFRYTALLRKMGRVEELRELAATEDWWAAEADLAALLKDVQAEDGLR